MSQITYEIQPHNYSYYDCTVGADVPLNFTELCEASKTENMKPLTPRAIKEQVYGMAMIRSYLSANGVLRVDPVSYSGITGFTERGGQKLAIIGGMLTLPGERSMGHSFRTVSALCDTLASAQAISRYGHQGVVARCNEQSQQLVSKLGFQPVGLEAGKIVMLKLYE